MTKDEFKNLVKAIRCAYPNSVINSQSVFDFWYEMLSDANYAEVTKALKQHIQTNRFSPTIAELRQGTRIKDKFNNFLPRGYDMDRLEIALLNSDRPKELTADTSVL